MNNRTLDLADFAQSNKLNLSVFKKSNLSEGLMTHEQFATQYPSVEVFSKANLDQFTSDAIATKNPDIIAKAKEEISLLKAKRVLVPTPEGTKIATIYFRGDNKNNIISHEDEYVDIQKGKLDELEKGGEGSRGGKIIGHTKSGKAIYDSHGHSKHANFTKQDHQDAADLHEDKMDGAESMDKMADHEDQMIKHTKSAGGKLTDPAYGDDDEVEGHDKPKGRKGEKPMSKEERDKENKHWDKWDAKEARNEKKPVKRIKKAEGEEDEDTIEKGISDALSYDSTIKIKKTGAQIKTALSNLQTFLEGKVSEMKRTLDTMLGEFDMKPTNEPKIYVAGSYYGSDTFGMDFKTFPWEATYCNESDGSSKGIDMPSYPGLKTATSKEEATSRSKYNELVNQCMENCVDILTCKVLRNSLEDKQSYELSVRQLQILGFGAEPKAEEIEKGGEGYVTKSPIKEDDGAFEKELAAIRALKAKKKEDIEEETEDEGNEENGETTED